MILVQIKGIKGDSRLPGYRDEWFSVDNFEFGVERQTKESAKVGTDDITIGVGELTVCTFQKSTDIASVDLMNYSISGGPLEEAFIYFVQTKDKDAQQVVMPYLLFRLEPCFIKTWKVSGDADERPKEDVSLWYQKITMEYYSYSRQGDGSYLEKSAGKAGWDQVENRKFDAVEFDIPKG